MSYGEDILDALTQARALAEELMVDSCVVTRIDPNVPPDPETGLPTRVQVYPDPTWPADHPWAGGKAKSQTYEGYEQNPVAGEHTFTVQRYSAHFPAESFDARPGDRIQWTACPMDPDRVGTVDRVAGPYNKTLTSAMRLFVDRMEP